MPMRIPALLLFLSLCVPAFSQTDTLKIRKNPNERLTFIFFKKLLGKNIDSVITSFNNVGFVPGSTYIKDETFTNNNKYFTKDSFDIRLVTYNDTISRIILLTKIKNTEIGESLFSESMMEGYKVCAKTDGDINFDRCTENGNCRAELSIRRTMWTFELSFYYRD